MLMVVLFGREAIVLSYFNFNMFSSFSKISLHYFYKKKMNPLKLIFKEKKYLEPCQKLVPKNITQKRNSKEADERQLIFLDSEHMCGFLFSKLSHYLQFFAPLFFREYDQIQYCNIK